MRALYAPRLATSSGGRSKLGENFSPPTLPAGDSSIPGGRGGRGGHPHSPVQGYHSSQGKGHHHGFGRMLLWTITPNRAEKKGFCGTFHSKNITLETVL